MHQMNLETLYLYCNQYVWSQRKVLLSQLILIGTYVCICVVSVSLCGKKFKVPTSNLVYFINDLKFHKL